jgi:hypothetical protein
MNSHIAKDLLHWGRAIFISDSLLAGSKINWFTSCLPQFQIWHSYRPSHFISHVTLVGSSWICTDLHRNEFSFKWSNSQIPRFWRSQKTCSSTSFRIRESETVIFQNLRQFQLFQSIPIDPNSMLLRWITESSEFSRSLTIRPDSLSVGMGHPTRHVNLSVLCLTYRSPRVCLVCLFWSLKRW